ncbi:MULTISPECIES: cob(I)yrinic acid a,c-diamide adenosyltransferase [Polymorphospora]|uniref:Corrinoid adenosyltransferase n=1 Tax=Polymorphospora lycopeni TaxID=3140240 RepID=A0ABV5CT33_9ACTN
MSVHLTRIYTRTGDDGRTHLADLTRVPKTDPRVEAGGAVDELTAAVGVAVATPGDLPDGYAGWLRQVQNDLFDIGADVSRPGGGPAAGPAPDDGPRVDGSYVAWLEEICDRVNADLPALRSFVLPGGTPLSARLHVCRTVCRRAERRALAVPDVNPEVTRYLNRLSDLLFILARAAAEGAPEVLWQPGRRPGAA